MALVVRNSPADAGDMKDTCSTPGHVNPLQYSCLENPMDRRAWRATLVHRVRKSQTRLKQLSMYTWLKYKLCLFLVYRKVIQLYM